MVAGQALPKVAALSGSVAKMTRATIPTAVSSSRAANLVTTLLPATSASPSASASGATTWAPISVARKAIAPKPM